MVVHNYTPPAKDSVSLASRENDSEFIGLVSAIFKIKQLDPNIYTHI